QGRYFYEQGGPVGLEKAAESFQRAIALDPDYSGAWAWLGVTYNSQAGQAYVPVDRGFRKGREAVDPALRLNPESATAHMASGFIKHTYDWDWAGAETSYQRALVLEPANAFTLEVAAGLANTLGHFDEAVAMMRRAVELDPLNPKRRMALAWQY